MTHVLSVDPSYTGSSSLEFDDLEILVERFTGPAFAHASAGVFDLLALASMGPEESTRAASRFQTLPGWEVVPVLYVLPLGTAGIILPAAYRPQLDGFALGLLDSIPVRQRMKQFARPGLTTHPPVVAGPFRLDQLAKVLRFEGQSVELTERETTILAVLLGSPGQVFDPQEIALTAWNGESPGDIDLARRHVSNLRSKLEAIPEAPRIATQRGIGYRVDVDI